MVIDEQTQSSFVLFEGLTHHPPREIGAGSQY